MKIISRQRRGSKKQDHHDGGEQREGGDRQQGCRKAISISDQARHERCEKRDAHVGSVNHRDDATGEILRCRFHRRRNDHRTKRPEERTESSESEREEWASGEVRNGNDEYYAREREPSD